MTTFARPIVIKALVGSHNYNLNTPESDEDWKFFVAPTFDDLYFGKRWSGGNHSEELDYSAHDIRQLADLLWKANLNFLEVLFSKKYETNYGFGVYLRTNADLFATMNLRAFGFATLGMHRQKMTTIHKGTEKSQKLVDAFGYDTKDAIHAVRCLLVAQRVAEGQPLREALWFENGTRNYLLDLKAGEIGEQAFRDYVTYWHEQHFDEVEAFYKEQEPKQELHDELQEQTKDFIQSLLV